MNLTVPVSRQALQPTDCWVLPPDDKYQVSQDRFLSMWSFPVVWKRGKLSNRIFTLFLSTRPRDCRASLPGAISLPPGDDNWTKVEETRSYKSSPYQTNWGYFVYSAPLCYLPWYSYGKVLFEKEGLRYAVYVYAVYMHKLRHARLSC